MKQLAEHGGSGKIIVTHILAASLLAFAAAAAARYHRLRKKSESVIAVKVTDKIAPKLDRAESGSNRPNLESFSHYVARQLGFSDADECKELGRLAYDYLKNKKGCEVSIYEFFGNEADAEALYAKLIEEFDRCILAYFGFHWSQAPLMISQVLSAGSAQQKTKLKDFVLTATRKQRFERVSKDLEVTRVLSTLVDEIKAINGPNLDDSKCTDVMVPVAFKERSPVLLLMGGGMGAGKSTVLKTILKESFWSGAAAKAVIVEADAFKETDVIYRALNSRGRHDDMLQTAELVHQSSTDAASSLLVTALNEGRDVIMDGTLSWEPFVQQTIAMVRDVHRFRYRMGVGYKVARDGSITENYWEKIVQEEEEDENARIRKPYRIELVGVVCDPFLAVVRGIRRAIMVGRAVRVNSQLNSHKRFATLFPSYCQLVDHVRLYCTSSTSGPAKLIGWKEGEHNNKLLVDPEEIQCLTTLSNLNADAESIYELYSDPGILNGPDSVWKEITMSPSRAHIQQQLRDTIRRLLKNETPPTPINM